MRARFGFSLSRRQRWGTLGALLGLLVVVLVALGIRRYRHRYRAMVVPSQRALSLEAQRSRPRDHWPRGEGHVVLAWPGSRAEDKSYHEPGGSFSPTVGSFGLALAVADAQGALVTTSDELPLTEIEQSFEAAADAGKPPRLIDATRFYRSELELVRPAHWKLSVWPSAERTPELVLLVRSVGPAGGPVRKLRWSDGTLRVNERFVLRFTPAPSSLLIAEEPSRPKPDWLARPAPNAAPPEALDSEPGWLCARLGWFPARGLELELEDTWPVPESPLSALRARPLASTNVDPSFERSLFAQLAHLRMSLVGTETRPGEPTNYPLEWLRDGAYVVVALARAGETELAARLAERFAERDFFGGFGPEADNPAFAIWVLDEVSRALGEAAYDQRVYPHVLRKARFIERMLETRAPLHELPLPSPIVPSWIDSPKRWLPLSLVSDPSRDGLIVGRMDGHFPLIFVNSINYLGLERAARFAERAGDAARSAEFTRRAATLRAAIVRALPGPEREDERSAIAGLWPSFALGNERAAYRALLRERDQRTTPKGGARPANEWSYFDVAEAHQWLELGEPAQLWKMLSTLFEHQSARGLYTWGEGHGEENAYGLWENVRGFLRPSQITPHYWTSAEMLLLQLEMLAYVDESDRTAPRWVLAAGARPEWLRSPFAVKGVGTSRGVADFDWDPTQRTLRARLRGERGEVALGPAFPSDARLEVSFVADEPEPRAEPPRPVSASQQTGPRAER